MSKSISPLTLWRKAQGWSQRDLGLAVGVQDAAITKWEKGRVPAERVLAVAKITGIPPHRLRPDLYPEPTPHREGAA